MTGTFISIDGLEYTVTIGSDEGTLVLGEDPVHISWSKGEHLFVPVRTSECSIRIKTSEDMSSLYTDDPLGCPVTVYQGSTCLFMGYLTPQVWDAPYRGIHDEVELIAVDAVAVSNNLRFFYETTAPHLSSPADLISRFISQVGITRTNIVHGYTQSNINEEAFLPKHWDASEFSDERKTWMDVLKAIGTWEMLTFWLVGDVLYARTVETLLGRTSQSLDLRGSDSAGTDIRMCIEPAKSHIQVEYSDLSEMSLVPEITIDRLEGTLLSENTAGSGESSTYTRYFVSKDWLTSGDSRAGCGAILINSDEEETPCIVGPANILVSARHCNTIVSDNRGIKFSMQAWAKNDMTVDSNGYEVLEVYTSTSNFNPNIYVESDGVAISKQLDIFGQSGLHSCSVSIYPSDSADFSGVINIFIPEHCVVANIKSELPERAYNSNTSKWETLSKVENDGIVELRTSGYNDSITISATLRASIQAWAAGDVHGDVAVGWDKFPFCNTSQFSVPRKRFTATVTTPAHFVQYEPVADTELSAQKLFVDGADYDLKMHRVTLNLLETYVSA